MKYHLLAKVKNGLKVGTSFSYFELIMFDYVFTLKLRFIAEAYTIVLKNHL